MTIDSHQHFWHYNPATDDWIGEDMAGIRRDFLPANLLPILEQNSVEGSVVVQVDQTLEETDWLLELADGHDFIKGVVGWVDLRSEELEAQLDRYAGRRKLKGFRHLVQGESDRLFMLRPDFLRGIEVIVEREYTYDLVIFPHQLEQALELVAAFPRGRFVIDHLAKPHIAAGYLAGWEVGVRAFSNYQNCYCKLSGMVTEADYEDWSAEQLHPYMQVVLETFGPDRLMFGSDWPVCLVATDYGRWKRVVEAYLRSTVTDLQFDRIMGGAVTDFYKL